MKRFLLVLFAILLFASPAYSVGSAFTLSSVSYYTTASKVDRVLLTFTVQADSITADFPTYTLDPTTYTNLYSINGLKGWYLYEVRVDPGTIGPTTAAWDFSITGATTGVLYSQSLLDNLSATDSTWVVFNPKYPYDY